MLQLRILATQTSAGRLNYYLSNACIPFAFFKHKIENLILILMRSTPIKQFL